MPHGVLCIQYSGYLPRYVRLRITKAHEYLKLKFLMCCLCDFDLPFEFYSGGSIGELLCDKVCTICGESYVIA